MAKVDLLMVKILNELESSTGKFGPFHSTHEGYAVIKEELDELWEKIKKNASPEEMREEAVQVAAMAARFMLDLCE